MKVVPLVYSSVIWKELPTSYISSLDHSGTGNQDPSALYYALGSDPIILKSLFFSFLTDLDLKTVNEISARYGLIYYPLNNEGIVSSSLANWKLAIEEGTKDDKYRFFFSYCLYYFEQTKLKKVFDFKKKKVEDGWKLN